MKAQTAKIEDFSGGLNTKSADISIDDNQCVRILNLEFEPRGSLVKRKGQSLYNGTALASGGTSIAVTKVYHLKKFYHSDGTVRGLAWGWMWDCTGEGDAGSHVMLFEDDGNATFTELVITDLTDNLLEDAYVWTTTMRDKVIFTNGADIPYWVGKTGNGKRLGIIGPATLTGAASNTGGNLTEDKWYRYKVTYKNGTDTIESEPKELVTQCAGVGNDTITLTIATTSDANVNQMRIYRSHEEDTETDAAAADLYLVAQVSDSGSYVDTIADASLTVAYDTDVDDNQPPPTDPEFCMEHDNRLFLIGDPAYPYRLFFSKIGEPDYFPTNNYIDIGRLDVDKPKALMVLNEYLWIGSANGWRKVNTDGATSGWSVSDPYNGPGIFAERSVAVCDAMRVPVATAVEGGVIYGQRGVIIYLSLDGLVVAFDGNRYFLVGKVIQPTLRGLLSSILLEAVGVYYPVKNQYRLSINDVSVIV